MGFIEGRMILYWTNSSSRYDIMRELLNALRFSVIIVIGHVCFSLFHLLFRIHRPYIKM